MILKRFYDERLAQASYLVGCSATGEALVIDPNRDVEQYLQTAESEGLRIVAVTETHIHADFVSGSRELAKRTVAKLFLSDEGDAAWKYAFAHEPNVILVKDRDTIHIGNLRLDVLHTPGHTPEHLSFQLTDTVASAEPMGIFTGDFVFVGDVGRPDLLERAANQVGTMNFAARTLFRSLQEFKTRPAYLQIWPGHGAGSACGKGLSAVPQSTVGFERLANWAFALDDEDAFAQAVLNGQPEPPRYFGRMKRINRDGPVLLDESRRCERLSRESLAPLLGRGETVVDVRSAREYAHGHIPGTLNVPFDRSFLTWAGWLLPYDLPIYLLLDDRAGQKIDEITHELTKIGLDRTAGYFGTDAISSWQDEGRTLGTIPQMTPTRLEQLRHTDSVTLVDVRGLAEWEDGHIPEAQHIPLGYLTTRLDEIPRGRPVVVYCRSGARSAIAASLLRSHGVADVLNLEGGYDLWTRIQVEARGGHGR